MRILFVADVSSQEVIGGAERMLFEQSTRLARRGHEVQILTRKPAKDARILWGEHRISERRYAVNPANALSYLCSTLINSRRLFESMFAEAPFDCIHFHQPFTAAGVLWSPRSLAVPKFYTSYSLSFEEFLSRNPTPCGRVARAIHRLNAMVRKYMEKRVLKASDTIIVLSRFSESRLKAAYGIPKGRIECVPGAVDTDIFKPVLDKRSVRKRLRLPEDRVILFTVRNLVARMGLENLLVAFRQLSQKTADLMLVIGGSGPLENRLKDLARREAIADMVRFTGFIPEADLPSYYQMSDLFVLPTRELEGFGLVTLESMACGVPVVGTPVGGTMEILGRLDPCFLFKDTSPEAIAELVWGCYLRMKDFPRQWADIEGQCRSFVERHYSWDASIDALERLYEKSAFRSSPIRGYCDTRSTVPPA